MEVSVRHQQFLERLRASHVDVWLVAKWLSERGNIVTINPNAEAKTAADWEKFVDMGDLTIQQRIEVKGLKKTDFTGREDWPHPVYIVCRAQTFDDAVPEPYAYIHLNAQRTHVGVVLVGPTRSKWFRRDVTEAAYGGKPAACYCCPLEEVIFTAL